MSNTATVTQLHTEDDLRKITRGAFVKELMDSDGRSARYMAGQIGISNSAFSDRLKGKASFLADELEQIARVLKIEPVEFYRAYIGATENPHQSPNGGNVGPAGIEPTTYGVEVRHLAPVTSINDAPSILAERPNTEEARRA